MTTALIITGSLLPFPTNLFNVARKAFDDGPFSRFIGKEKFLVETDNVVVTGSRQFAGISDKLRADSQKYWVENAFGVFMPNKSNDNTEHFSFEYSKPQVIKEDLPAISQHIVLRANKDSSKFSIRYQDAGQNVKAFNVYAWNDYITELSESLSARRFSDHAYKIALPFTKEQLDEKAVAQNPPFVDIIPEYNYYTGPSEKALNLPENILPLFYTFAVVDKNAKATTDNPGASQGNVDFFTKAATLAGKVKGGLIFQANHGKKEDQGKIGNLAGISKVNKNYYQNFIKTAQKDTGSLDEVRDKFSNIVFPIEDVDILKDYNTKKDLFPMYVELNISAKDQVVLSTAFKDANLTNALMQKLLDIERVSSTALGERSVETFFEKTDSIIKGESKRELAVEKLFDVIEWVNKVQTDGSSTVSDDLNTFSKFIGEHRKTQDIASDDRYKFFRALSVLILKGKLNTLLAQYNRTYQDIMSGKMSYSEPFLYKVSKYPIFAGDTPAAEPAQRYYFPNASEIEVLTFIDTQVKYDLRYRYVIEQFNFVIGSKYEYKNFKNTPGGNTAEFDVISRPNLVLIGTEYATLDTIVVDDAPMFPDVQFIPWKGISNRVNVWLSNNRGDYLLEPVFIGDDPAAKKAIERIKLKQKRDGKIRYKSDDPILSYEVYRIEEHPRSYDDFDGGLRRRLNKQDAFIDEIEPNTKYYYTTRAIDIHGNYSNPSAVFEVEMVDNSGAVYLVVNVVDFNRGDVGKYFKAMKRYIQISPAFQQALVNEEKSDLIDAASALNKKIVFGEAEEGLLGKSFKIRLTSRHTGKQIDLNLSFQKEKVKVEGNENH